MPRTAVVTDSTAYLPPEMAAGNSIEVVSLYVNFAGDRTERELDLMADLDKFYDEIRSADQWPTTSQPSVGDFVTAYEPLLADGGEVVSIHISEGISGTADSARQAAELLEKEGKGGERVRVVNSQSSAGGLGMITLGAASTPTRSSRGRRRRANRSRCGSRSTRSSSSSGAGGSARPARGSDRR